MVSAAWSKAASEYPANLFGPIAAKDSDQVTHLENGLIDGLLSARHHQGEDIAVKA
jgi:hypothetical protein